MFTSFSVAFNAAIFSLPYGQVLLSLARPFLSAMDLNSLNKSSAKVAEFAVKLAMGNILEYTYNLRERLILRL